MLRAFLFSILAFLVCVIVVYLAVVMAVLVYWSVTGFHDREGAGAMGLIFVLGPGVALPSGLIAAIVTFVKSRQRAKRAAPVI